MWQMIYNKINNDGSMGGISQVLWSKTMIKDDCMKDGVGGELGHKEMVEYIVREKEGEDNSKVNVGRWSSEFPDIVEEVEKEL